MQRLSSLIGPPKSADFLSTIHHASHTLFTPRYIGFVGGGILIVLFIAAAMVENAAKPAPALQRTDTSPGNQTQNIVTPDSMAAADNASNSSKTQTHLQVNGQDVPIPSNDTTTQTITDGSTHTVVHTSENSSQTANSNSSSVTINVDSVTSGGT